MTMVGASTALGTSSCSTRNFGEWRVPGLRNVAQTAPVHAQRQPGDAARRGPALLRARTRSGCTPTASVILQAAAACPPPKSTIWSPSWNRCRRCPTGASPFGPCKVVTKLCAARRRHFLVSRPLTRSSHEIRKTHPGAARATRAAADGALPRTRTTADRQVHRHFAGSKQNATSLVTGLRDAKQVTLTSGDKLETFTPPTGKMGYGNVDNALALAERVAAKRKASRSRRRRSSRPR